MKNTDIKHEFQKELEKNFNIFLKVNFEGNKILILPLKEDIPIIEHVKYLSEKDEFEILFHSKNNSFKNENIGSFLVCYMDTNDNLMGLKIKNIKNVLKDSKRVCNLLTLNSINTEFENDICVRDSNNRIIHFFRDIVKNILPRLENSKDLKDLVSV